MISVFRQILESIPGKQTHKLSTQNIAWASFVKLTKCVFCSRTEDKRPLFLQVKAFLKNVNVSILCVFTKCVCRYMCT